MSEWATGLFAAVAVLASLYRARTLGAGELLDVSMLEAVATAGALAHPVTFAVLAGRPMREGRTVNLPGIYRAKDGWVGFMVIRGQQWLDFCVLVGRPDWAEDESLLLVENRLARFDELTDAIETRLSQQTAADILDLAEDLRVPAAPLGNGAETFHFAHLRESGMFEPSPDATFLQPAPPFRIAGGPPRQQPGPSPRLGEHTDKARADSTRPTPTHAETTRTGGRPLEGVRVADLTAYWAGPTAGRFLAMFGADVIRVESPMHMDGFRSSIRPEDPQWWEWSPMVAAINVGKRHLGLDLSTDRGRELLLRLVDHCDVLIENYTPRVLDHWRLDHQRLLARNPDLLVVRMPAYGLEGPWRNRPGYAQTMEMTSGMAWVTGNPDGPPMLPNGQVDPLGGNMALVAILLALEHRRQGGTGTLVEVPLIAGALTIASEQVIEYTSTGRLLGRLGNRHPRFAPQGVYRCAGAAASETWVAISVTTDNAWKELVYALGQPSWATGPELETVHGRRDAHNLIDAELEAWCRSRTPEQVVAALWARGIATGTVLMPHEQLRADPLRNGGFYQEVDHPHMGGAPYQTYPVRFSTLPSPMIRSRTPLVGEHTKEILQQTVGTPTEEVAELEALGIVHAVPD
jgi:crotonobetainyl-CoA:carnitine CoA-transferase CaiB-like acyl-CoA transferase